MVLVPVLVMKMDVVGGCSAGVNGFTVAEVAEEMVAYHQHARNGPGAHEGLIVGEGIR